MNELASIQREFPYPNPRDRVPMHEYYGEPASDDFKVDSPLREQNMQSFRDARRYIFTDSVLNMKSMTHLFPKDTCIFHMPRATCYRWGMLWKFCKVMNFWLNTSRPCSILDQINSGNTTEE